MKSESHIRAINQTLRELQPLSVTTAAPASMQFQYIGTIVDNTMALLTGVANSLDNGQRVARFSEFANWLSAMKAVHRSFYSSLIIAIEQGLSDFCAEKGIKPEPHRLTKAERIIEKGNLSSKLAKEVRQLAGGKPNFGDYLREVLRAKEVPKNRRVVWTNFFEALNVVRNKVSHSDIVLAPGDTQKLKNGGLGVLVGADNMLQVNTRNYRQIISLVLKFYEEVGLA